MTNDANKAKSVGSTPAADRFPCCPNSVIRESAWRRVCTTCGSWEDLAHPVFQYDDSYPAQRFHFEAPVAMAKVRSVERCLERTHINLEGKIVCEVGFGSGHVLSTLARTARAAYGIEAVEANIRNAVALGLPEDHLYLADQLPADLPERIGLWCFFDSFEHLPQPEEFMTWVSRNSAPGALIVVVAPDGASPSARVLRRLWPHRLPDHRFHWSTGGLKNLMGRFNFGIQQIFPPMKYVTVATLLSHACRWGGFTLPNKILRSQVGMCSVVFNMGELGMVFRKTEAVQPFKTQADPAGLCIESRLPK
jgi:2-polyprenyl-3-methyl-5-hydroxy-6-metoxy-1,4-benzoquinol methylase